MARKRNKVAEPTTEQRLALLVDAMLSAEHITPMQIYEVMLMGHRVYRQGVGIPERVVLDAILSAFKQHHRHYMNPYQIAQLRGHSDLVGPTEMDWETLRSYT